MKSILITGATSGIGLSLVEAALAAGYHVIACGRDPSKLDDLPASSALSTLCFDVTDTKHTQQALSTVQADIYVFNAGTCEYVDVNQFDPDLFKRVFNTNFFGVVNGVNAIIKQLNSGTQIVMVDSLARLLPFQKSQAYGASKAALYYFANSLQVDLKSKGVLVQTVSPGFVKTPLTDKNAFSMPMRIESTTAAAHILNGIEKRKSHIRFPWFFSTLLRLLSALPMKLQIKLCQHF